MGHRQAQIQVADVARALVRPRRTGPVAAAYHWRYEVLLAVGVPLVALAINRLAGLAGLLAAAAILVTTLVAWPAARRRVLAQVRAVVIQHRLRTAFAQTPVLALDGRTPTILRAGPRSGGTRVLLWCPAGIDVRALRAQRRPLAAACYADDVWITRHPKYEHLVTMFVWTP